MADQWFESLHSFDPNPATVNRLPESSRRFDIERNNGRAVLRLAGRWRLTDGVRLFDAGTLGGDDLPDVIELDGAGLEDWDSSLVAFVLRVVVWARDRDIRIDADKLPRNILELVRLSTAVPDHAEAGPKSRHSAVARLGEHVMVGATTTTETFTFVGESALSIGRLLIGRSRMRWAEFWSVIQDAGPSALPIVTLISFLVGLILAFLGATVLTQFGAGIYTAHLVGFGMLRELGAMMTAIIMVGRTGASFAARIGTMRVAEELDAFQTMGVSVSDYIVLPRLLALSIMMPLLTLYADVVGVAGGMLISMTIQDVTPRLFMNTLVHAVQLEDFTIGIVKGAVFGVLIAVTGCLRGMQCGSNAEAVGKATTSAVVTGTTLVILANAVIDWLETIG